MNRPPMRALARFALGLALAAGLAACAAPTPPADAHPPAPGATPATMPTDPAAPVAPPADTAAGGTAPAGNPPVSAGAGQVPDLDTRCRTDSDCVVKDVGNCCGTYPACVNQDSPADPQAVMAECRRSGMASVCGFREIQACACVQQRCEAVDAGRPVTH